MDPSDEPNGAAPRGRLARTLHEPHIILAVCGLAVFTDVVGTGVVIPAIPEFAALFGASEATMGLAFSAFALAFLVAVLPFGRLVGATGRVDLAVGGGMAAIAAAALAFALARSTWGFAFGQALHGVGSAATWVAAQPLAARLARERSKSGLWFGAITAAMGFGLVLGPLVGAIGGLRTPFVVYLGFAVAAVPAVLVVLRGSSVPVHTGSPGYRNVLAEPRVLAACLVILVLYLGIGFLEVLFPLFMDARGAGKGEVGVLFFWFALFMVVSQPLAGRWMDRVGPAGPTVVAVALLAPLFVVSVLGHGFGWWVPVFALLGVVVGVPVSATMMLIATGSPPGSHAVAYALWNFSFAIGYLVGPALGGVTAEAGIAWFGEAGIGLPFYGFAVVAIVTAAVVRRLAADRPRGS